MTISTPSRLNWMAEKKDAGPAVRLEIRPRVQKDKWSLYWKESMETKTELLSTQALEISPSTKVAEMHSLLASKLGWPAVDGLERLEGFTAPWEFSVFRGRVLKADDTLESYGISAGAVITTVRHVLVPEACSIGWKIIEEGQDEDDVSSDEEW